MDNGVTHVAMDTHKKEHAVAWVYRDTGEAEAFTVKNTVKEVTKTVRRAAADGALITGGRC